MNHSKMFFLKIRSFLDRQVFKAPKKNLWFRFFEIVKWLWSLIYDAVVHLEIGKLLLKQSGKIKKQLNFCKKFCVFFFSQIHTIEATQWDEHF